MSFRFKKVDSVQEWIVKNLRAVGASVQSIASVGRGCPDIVVGYHGVNYLFEIKTPGPKSKQKLTADEKKWQEAWKGECWIVDHPEQALKVIGAI